MTKKKSYFSILFVDDEEKSAKYFSKAFKDDFNIITTTNAKDAWDIVDNKSSEIAVVVSDQRMPKSSGVELLNKIRNKYPNITRILTTAYADLEDNIAAINQSHVFAYLTKPWKLEEVRDVLNRAVSEFNTRLALLSLSGSIAHEMRNPLNSVINSFETIRVLLPEKPSKDDKNNKYYLGGEDLSNIYQGIDDGVFSIKRGNKIINTILTNIQGKEIDKSTFSCLDAKKSIKKALKNYGHQEDGDKNLINVNFDQDFKFFGDEDLFIYTIFNLIKNSLYYKKANPEFKININLKNNKNSNLIKIKDNGPGIAEEKLDSIFESFINSKKKDGTGLGLPFCKRVMKSFGGTIDCKSNLGKWTEFTLSFPIYDSKFADNARLEILRQKRILIVDDEDINLLVARKHLSNWTDNIDEAKNGQEALNKIENTDYDLIFMDIEMPIMDGITAAEQIRGKKSLHYQKVPIITLSSLNKDKTEDKIIKAGMNAFFSKPITKESLNGILDQWLFTHYDQKAIADSNFKNRIDNINFKPRTILIVDDEPIIAKTAGFILKKIGHKVLSANNGKEAMEILNKNQEKIDIILMDTEMPIMNGIQAAIEIRKSKKLYNKTPIIAITGNVSDENIKKVLGAGMNNFLGKPFSRGDLEKMVCADFS